MATLADRERDGTTSLTELARQLCRIAGAFGFIIEAKYPTGSPVRLLYDAMQNVCSLLPAAEEALFDPQSDNAGVIGDPENIPGINPGAAAPPPPPEEE